MQWDFWAVYMVTVFVLSLAPGPAVLLVVSQGMSHGWRSALGANFGIELGNAVYFMLSGVGLSAALLALGDWFFAVRWLGAAYLVYLGLASIFGRSTLLAAGRAPVATPSGARAAVRGLAVQLGNPKALVFFAALLPQFLDPAGSLPMQLAVYGVTGIGLEFLVLAGYGAVAARARAFALRPGADIWLNRVAGAMLLIAAFGVATMQG